MSRRAPFYFTMLALWMVSSAAAEVLLSEPFGYPDGQLIEVSGGTWNHLANGGATGQVAVASGAVLLAQGSSEDVYALISGQPYPAVGPTNIFYASFKLKLSSLPGGAGAYFAHFKDSNLVYRARVWLLTNGAAPGCFRIGLSSANSSSASVTNQTDFGPGTNITVVTRLIASNSAATLWMNPQRESDPGLSTTDASSGISVVAYSLREATGNGSMILDDLLIGTSFYDVVPPLGPPEITAQPQSQTVVEGTNVIFSIAAVGAPPLSFQWYYNEVLITNATNASLALKSVTTTEAGVYRASVSNILGFSSSEPAQLAVSLAPVPPSIIAEPQNLSVTLGTDVYLSVEAAGTSPLAYQWRFYGTNLSGANGSALSLVSVMASQTGPYEVAITNVAGAVTSTPANLRVTIPRPEGPTNFSILTYNVKGNNATNWTTNSPQVRAIGRQLQYLHPDIITFQEIPNDYTYEMTNFVRAFLPGYSLATNSGTDGWIRSVVASRFPIRRSQSWLTHADLDPYGYTNANFTRDLFEAEIAVPGFEQPLHVFTTHLKSGSASTDLQKRAAEAAAISNFLVTTFPATFGSEPYLLTGDLNEPDINQLSIQRLVSAPTGLQLTAPVNPVTQSYFTYSSTSTTKRFDYILPAMVLFTNILDGQVFRTDVLTNPSPAGLLANDSQTASDHLPVMMYFANPYRDPFQVRSCTFTNGTASLTWTTGPNRVYSVEASSNLTDWTVIASNLSSSAFPSLTLTTNLPYPVQFFRIYRVP